MFIGVVDASMGNILHKVGTGKFQTSERFCHSNSDIFFRGCHIKYPDFLNLDICFWLGLKSVISLQAWAHQAAEQVWTLNLESNQDRRPLCFNTIWIRWKSERKWTYQDSETSGLGFSSHYFFIRTLRKIGKLIDTLPSQKSIAHCRTWILTC